VKAAMNQIVRFPNRKQVVLREALETAEASVTSTFANLDWLKRNGASFAEQVKASLKFNAALDGLHQRKAALSQLHSTTQG
jgi:hypothetical protein